MKWIKHAAWAVVLVALAGCAATFRPWSLSEVEPGMSRAQVIRILGEPDNTEIGTEGEILYYTYMESYNPPLTDDSILTTTQNRMRWERQMERASKEYRYAVRLVDGKVHGYRELTD